MRYSNWLLMILFFLSSCVHGPSLQQRLNSHIGESIDVLVTKFGPSTQTQKLMNGDTLYLYKRYGATRTTAQAIPWNFNGEKQLVTETSFCETQYVADANGIIKNASYRGDCR